ncbi:hypothetical protein DY218_24795 [Streptomyces triticagri]|uniref:Uncharacterized protein n=2 Tax=Streptomyces triticagri TaxID=2293568 RepID=A0A372LZ34_9ACTN|nr:hypothetical protein DY218_24795 [Streptomyces triticagri]
MGFEAVSGVLPHRPDTGSVPSAGMDTLIFGGLLATWLVLYRRRGRTVLLVCWWVVIAAVGVLLSHHITSSLGLGLSY